MEANIIVRCDRCGRVLTTIYAKEDMSVKEWETMTINECHCMHCREEIEGGGEKGCHKE